MKTKVKRVKDYTETDDRIKCKICGKEFAHLGSHIAHGHKITANEYKAEFGLPYNFSLINQTVHQKKSDKFQERREEILANFNTEKSKACRFKKGSKRPKDLYRSEKARKDCIENLNKMNNNKWEECPICKMKFLKLSSHLYNKHNLLKIE
jgi:hypothetical protein